MKETPRANCVATEYTLDVALLRGCGGANAVWILGTGGSSRAGVMTISGVIGLTGCSGWEASCTPWGFMIVDSGLDTWSPSLDEGIDRPMTRNRSEGETPDRGFSPYFRLPTGPFMRSLLAGLFSLRGMDRGAAFCRAVASRVAVCSSLLSRLEGLEKSVTMLRSGGLERPVGFLRFSGIPSFLFDWADSLGFLEL